MHEHAIFSSAGTCRMHQISCDNLFILCTGLRASDERVLCERENKILWMRCIKLKSALCIQQCALMLDGRMKMHKIIINFLCEMPNICCENWMAFISHSHPASSPSAKHNIPRTHWNSFYILKLFCHFLHLVSWRQPGQGTCWKESLKHALPEQRLRGKLYFEFFKSIPNAKPNHHFSRRAHSGADCVVWALRGRRCGKIAREWRKHKWNVVAPCARQKLAQFVINSNNLGCHINTAHTVARSPRMTDVFYWSEREHFACDSESLIFITL